MSATGKRFRVDKRFRDGCWEITMWRGHQGWGLGQRIKSEVRAENIRQFLEDELTSDFEREMHEIEAMVRV